MPHIDDETFTCGGYIKSIPHFTISQKHFECNNVFEQKNVNSNITILTFCNAECHNQKQRLSTYSKNCEILNANYIIMNFDDLSLYKNPHQVYIDILYKLFNHLSGKLSIVIPSENDLHQEHRLVSQCSKIACRKFLNKITCIKEFKQPFENFDNSVYPICLNVNKDELMNYNTETQPIYSYAEYYRIIYESGV